MGSGKYGPSLLASEPFISQLGDAVSGVEKWIAERTRIDPLKARMRVLDMVLWICRDFAERGDGWEFMDYLDATRAVESTARGAQNAAYWVRNGRRVTKTPEEKRMYYVGMSQVRGGSQTSWYAIPPEPKVDSLWDDP